MVTKGEITEVATIPIGQNVPKTLSETGAVRIWAPQEADKELERKFGVIFDKINLKKFDVSKIPAKAP